MEIGIYQAKTHFARLIERVAKGERITISKHGKPVAELRPIAGARDPDALDQAIARLQARRNHRPPTRKPLSTEEIIAARDQGRQ